MNNPTGTTEVAIGVFGGLNTDITPTDLPQGLSPACENVAFLPGSVFTRPPLKQASTIAAEGQIVYVFSFRKADGSEVVLQFGAKGGIYANGTKIGQTQAGNRFKAISMFNRAYIAISDADHGADIPLQYDGINLDRVSQDGPGAAPVVNNLGIDLVSLVSLNRASNAVTASTSAAHGLLPGYQATIQGVTDQVIGGSVQSVVIDNTSLPGLATVTLASAHGLVPQDYITLSGVQNTQVGGGIASLHTSNGTATLTTNTPHGLQAGANIVVVNKDGNSGQSRVAAVITATQFNYAASGIYDSGAGGTVTLIWPDNNSSGSQTYQIQTVPSATSFTIPLDYASGTWQGGTVTFAWNGTFFIETVPSLTSFTYSQAGPDGSASGGAVTPAGQIAAGTHQCVVLFQTRTGFVTAPSPRVTFVASGGQYLHVTGIPTGPSNVTKRILAFTGTNGADFFYLPVAPQLNGKPSGTSTVLNDNVTTEMLLDFSDIALFNGLGIDIEGNNTFRQVVLGPCLGFYPYAGRLFAWGERNKVQSLLNMGFEGGVTAANQPLGWQISGGGVLTPVTGGLAWLPNAGTTLSQPAFQDQYGVAILEANTQYTFRAKVFGAVSASFYSASQGTLATATIAAQGFGEAVFSAKTPAVMPSDTVLRITSPTASLLDELEIYYTDNPYLKTARVSYEDNPEAFDGLTGLIGPANDPHEVRSMYVRRDVLHLLTDGPNGALYETQDTASGEPATWSVGLIAAKCGSISVWGDAQFEDWQIWASDTGLRIHDGGTVEKISQEVQKWWDSFNPAAQNLTVVKNDPYLRRVYCLAAVDSATTANSTYVMDYRELNTAGALSSSSPLKVSYTGKVLTTDLTRKWAPWTTALHYCDLLGDGDSAVMTFCGAGSVSKGATYTLLEGAVSGMDDDYGPFSSSYATYYMLSPEEAQQLKLQPHRKLFTYLTANIAGVGAVVVTPYVEENTPWRSSRPVPLKSLNAFDVQVPLNISADRASFTVTAKPLASSTQSGFRLSGITVALKDHPMSLVRGSNF